MPAAPEAGRGHGIRALHERAGLRPRVDARGHRREPRPARALSAAGGPCRPACDRHAGAPCSDRVVPALPRPTRSAARWVSVAIHAMDASQPARRAGPCRIRAIDDAAVHALRLELIGTIAAGIVAVTSVLLFAFGLNLLYLTVRALRLKAPVGHETITAGEPSVCVQIPIYDERYVAERVLDAVCAIDWPRERFEVQLLDDSDDDTTKIVARRVAHWRKRGIDVAHVRRAHVRVSRRARSLTACGLRARHSWRSSTPTSCRRATSSAARSACSMTRRSDLCRRVGAISTRITRSSRASRRWRSTSTSWWSRRYARPRGTSQTSPARPACGGGPPSRTPVAGAHAR